MIVDDDPVSRSVLHKILVGNPEHQITVADSGQAAWELLNDPARYFDVVFLDLQMPGPDGFELLRRIREAHTLTSVEVILCTASKDRDTITRVVQLGARHYLVKPCTPEIVQAKLKKLRPEISGPAERRLAGTG